MTAGAVGLGLVLVVVLTGCASTESTEPVAASGSTSDQATAVPPSTAPTAAEVPPVPSTVDPGELPQTRDRPGTDAPAFAAGSQALWRAIVADDPTVAMSFFFPLSAYQQVKAVKNPAADWQDRLVAALGRDVHRLHQEVGSGVGEARFVGLDVPTDRATWVDPGQEYNKLGYWRVYGTQLRYEIGGTSHALPIYSLISWRGEWYVVHVGPP